MADESSKASTDVCFDNAPLAVHVIERDQQRPKEDSADLLKKSSRHSVYATSASALKTTKKIIPGVKKTTTATSKVSPFQIFEDSGKENAASLSLSEMKSNISIVKKALNLAKYDDSKKTVSTFTKLADKRKAEKSDSVKPLVTRTSENQSVAPASTAKKIKSSTDEMIHTSVEIQTDMSMSEMQHQENQLERTRLEREVLVNEYEQQVRALKSQIDTETSKSDLLAYEKEHMVARLEMKLLQQMELAHDAEQTKQHYKDTQERLIQSENCNAYLVFLNEMHEKTSQDLQSRITHKAMVNTGVQCEPSRKSEGIQAITQDMYMTTCILKETRDEVAGLKFTNELLVQKISETQEESHESTERLRRKNEEMQRNYSAETQQWKEMLAVTLQDLQKTMGSSVYEFQQKILRLEAELKQEREKSRLLEQQLLDATTSQAASGNETCASPASY